MAEPTVQVPVSLIEDAVHLFKTAHISGRLPDEFDVMLAGAARSGEYEATVRSLLLGLAHRETAADVPVVEIKQTVYAALALLSQPTPTADPELIYTTMPVSSAPSIADMAPGTTNLDQWLYHDTDCKAGQSDWADVRGTVCTCGLETAAGHEVRYA